MAKAKEAQQSNERSTGLTRRESMSAAPWSASPFSMMNRFADEMERLFDNFGFGRGWGEMGQAMWAPQIEAFERDGKFIVRADLPGLNKDNVKVDITDNLLTFRASANRNTKRIAKVCTAASAVTAVSIARSRCRKELVAMRQRRASVMACSKFRCLHHSAKSAVGKSKSQANAG